MENRRQFNYGDATYQDQVAMGRPIRPPLPKRRMDTYHRRQEQDPRGRRDDSATLRS